MLGVENTKRSEENTLTNTTGSIAIKILSRREPGIEGIARRTLSAFVPKTSNIEKLKGLMRIIKRRGTSIIVNIGSSIQRKMRSISIIAELVSSRQAVRSLQRNGGSFVLAIILHVFVVESVNLK